MVERKGGKEGRKEEERQTKTEEERNERKGHMFNTHLSQVRSECRHLRMSSLGLPCLALFILCRLALPCPVFSCLALRCVALPCLALFSCVALLCLSWKL